MAVLPEEVKEAFDKTQGVAFITATKDAQPNANIVAMKKIIDDETVYLSDQFFKKTLVNIQQNPKVAILFWGKDYAYQIHGTVERYVNEGPEFEEQAAWVNAAGPDAGNQIA